MLDLRPDRDRTSYRPPMYPADRVLVGIVVGGVLLAALVACFLF